VAISRTAYSGGRSTVADLRLSLIGRITSGSS